MKWRWPWRRPDDTTEEALEQLALLKERDHEVQHLGQELREHQRRNHFSAMVAAAIARSQNTPKGGPR